MLRLGGNGPGMMLGYENFFLLMRSLLERVDGYNAFQGKLLCLGVLEGTLVTALA